VYENATVPPAAGATEAATIYIESLRDLDPDLVAGA
jgi:hypothetical protein